MKKKRNRSYFEFLVLFVLFGVVIHMDGGGPIKWDPNPADVPRLKTPLPLVASRV